MKKIVFNHKSYLDLEGIKKYKTEITKINPKNYELILMPQICYLSLFVSSKIKIGAQNFYSYNEGSYTGEANIKALKSLGVEYFLLGHSERRELVRESYELTRNKLFKSLNAKTKTILCVGEPNKKTNSIKYLKKELSFYLSSLEEENLKYLTIAYEPAWAIGGFESLKVEKIKKTTEMIKNYFRKKFDYEIEVLYGGSVDISNIKDIIDVTDGVLVGRISSNIQKAKELINTID